MSYTIEYARKVLVMPAREGWPAGSERDYLLLTQDGPNNVEPRPREWRVLSYGWTYALFIDICKAAGYTEGGMLKVNGRDIKPEAYIKLHRQAIAEAQPFSIDALHALGVHSLVLSLPINPAALPGYAVAPMNALRACGLFDPCESYSDTREAMRARLTEETWALWLALRGYDTITTSLSRW